MRQHHEASTARAAVEVEWRTAFEAKRTAETFEVFWSAALDQAAVHWILAVVFLRFLEDNRLVDQPLLSGPGERLELAQLRQQAFFRARPLDDDTIYLLDIFAEVSRLPGLAGLYDPALNPLFRLPLSADGTMALIGFWRERATDTGALAHDFTDSDWNTRFLGDLYQDLSEEARKRYALLQTPEFVEEWILSRTLDPAIREFDNAQVRKIAPTCGSGHFLLGGFARVLAEVRRHAPEMPAPAQAQQALDAVAGVDLNPFAVEIARFRLLLAALQASGELRLAAAPDFRLHLAVGDSLLHGRHFGAQRDFAQELDEGFQRRLRHHYVSEDTAEVDAILGRQYHAVVGNPPYITPKDPAMRDAYREIYASCHMKYGLGVPFIERFFELAIAGAEDTPAGFVGLIVANSFMKREFGSKLIEEVLPKLDLTHVVDCSGAYIPGHGTPTAIMFGRNRAPVQSVVRTVRGIRGEPSAPETPAMGLVWQSILAQTDLSQSTSDFISTEDTPRTALARHPWNVGGGGAVEVQAAIDGGWPKLSESVLPIGFASFPGADDVFIADRGTYHRAGFPETLLRPAILGENVRDWRIDGDAFGMVPIDNLQQPVPLSALGRGQKFMWPFRTSLGGVVSFGQQTRAEAGDAWWSWYRWVGRRYVTPLSITFGFVATHNHFVLDRGGKVFNRSAPVIKLPIGASEDDHLGLLGLLNSSTACFWMKQVFYPKGGDYVGQEGARVSRTPWDDRYEFTGTGLLKFPVVDERPLLLAQRMDAEAQRIAANLPKVICVGGTPTRECLDAARTTVEAARVAMIALQEELDWLCYRLYDLLELPPEHPAPPPIRFGERAFEIVMARRMLAGEVESTWFVRHNSRPVTDLPDQWPADYREVVERRIALIEHDPTIRLLERPEFKRRWSLDSWDQMELEALQEWLLNRLEDPRYWPEDAPQLTTTRALADAARHDADFVAVADLYSGQVGFDFEALVAELATKEAVPFLAVLRYSDTGRRRRVEWETTWDMQRREDAIDARLAARRDDFLRAVWTSCNPRRDRENAEAYASRLQAGLSDADIQSAADRALELEAKRLKSEDVGSIPVPPKYRTPDFVSQDYWRLRGGLDVPKERFVSFPHCARDADDSLPLLWAGYDHLARAKAIAAWYVERKDMEAWPAERLTPLLTGLLELVPWLKQWHNDLDPVTGLRMGDYFADFIDDQARELGLTMADLRAWTPPTPMRRTRRRRVTA